MAKIDKDNFCKACKELVGASRHSLGHQNLKFVDGRRCSSMMGAADEANYICSECGANWLHETGSCGMGWIC